MNNISDKRGIWMMLLTAIISPKLSLAALMTKLLAVKVKFHKIPLHLSKADTRNSENSYVIQVSSEVF